MICSFLVWERKLLTLSFLLFDLFKAVVVLTSPTKGSLLPTSDYFSIEIFSEVLRISYNLAGEYCSRLMV